MTGKKYSSTELLKLKATEINMFNTVILLLLLIDLIFGV